MEEKDKKQPPCDTSDKPVPPVNEAEVIRENPNPWANANIPADQERNKEEGPGSEITDGEAG